MMRSFRLLQSTPVYRLFTIFLLIAFNLTPVASYAQDLMWMPAPGVRVEISPKFEAPLLKGLTVHPENPLQFDFLIDAGDELGKAALVSNEAKKEEYRKLIKYFLSALTLPEKDMWVNLSPYEENRVIADNFSKTQMGRDLLAQDYLLKQLTASLIYPEEELGKTFWDRVYKEVEARFGKTEIPVNTFNKVWIVPSEAVVYETKDTAFIVRSHLKVMMEEDYLSMDKNRASEVLGTRHVQGAELEKLSEVASQAVREIVLPAIEKEINEGKNFALLRQIYSGMILATWYKQALKESLLGKIYMDKSKTAGVELEGQKVEESKGQKVKETEGQKIKESESQTQNTARTTQNDQITVDQIYAQYVEAFKKGVYNYIKEDYDPVTEEVIPRKYFSGGFDSKLAGALERIPSGDLTTADAAMLGRVLEKGIDRAMVSLETADSAKTPSPDDDNAMLTKIKNNAVAMLVLDKEENWFDESRMPIVYGELLAHDRFNISEYKDWLLNGVQKRKDIIAAYYILVRNVNHFDSEQLSLAKTVVEGVLSKINNKSVDLESTLWALRIYREADQNKVGAFAEIPERSIENLKIFDLSIESWARPFVQRWPGHRITIDLEKAWADFSKANEKAGRIRGSYFLEGEEDLTESYRLFYAANEILWNEEYTVPFKFKAFEWLVLAGLKSREPAIRIWSAALILDKVDRAILTENEAPAPDQAMITGATKRAEKLLESESNRYSALGFVIGLVEGWAGDTSEKKRFVDAEFGIGKDRLDKFIDMARLLQNSEFGPSIFLKIANLEKLDGESRREIISNVRKALEGYREDIKKISVNDLSKVLSAIIRLSGVFRNFGEFFPFVNLKDEIKTQTSTYIFVTFSLRSELDEIEALNLADLMITWNISSRNSFDQEQRIWVKSKIHEAINDFKADEIQTHLPAVLAARLLLEDGYRAQKRGGSSYFGFNRDDQMVALQVLKTVMAMPIVEASDKNYKSQAEANKTVIFTVHSMDPQYLAEIQDDFVPVISDDLSENVPAGHDAWSGVEPLRDMIYSMPGDIRAALTVVNFSNHFSDAETKKAKSLLKSVFLQGQTEHASEEDVVNALYVAQAIMSDSQVEYNHRNKVSKFMVDNLSLDVSLLRRILAASMVMDHMLIDIKDRAKAALVEGVRGDDIRLVALAMEVYYLNRLNWEGDVNKGLFELENSSPMSAIGKIRIYRNVNSDTEDGIWLRIQEIKWAKAGGWVQAMEDLWPSFSYVSSSSKSPQLKHLLAQVILEKTDRFKEWRNPRFAGMIAWAKNVVAGKDLMNVFTPEMQGFYPEVQEHFLADRVKNLGAWELIRPMLDRNDLSKEETIAVLIGAKSYILDALDRTSDRRDNIDQIVKFISRVLATGPFANDPEISRIASEFVFLHSSFGSPAFNLTEFRQSLSDRRGKIDLTKLTPGDVMTLSQVIRFDQSPEVKRESFDTLARLLRDANPAVRIIAAHEIYSIVGENNSIELPEGIKTVVEKLMDSTDNKIRSLAFLITMSNPSRELLAGERFSQREMADAHKRLTQLVGDSSDAAMMVSASKRLLEILPRVSQEQAKVLGLMQDGSSINVKIYGLTNSLSDGVDLVEFLESSEFVQEMVGKDDVQKSIWRIRLFPLLFESAFNARRDVRYFQLETALIKLLRDMKFQTIQSLRGQIINRDQINFFNQIVATARGDVPLVVASIEELPLPEQLILALAISAVRNKRNYGQPLLTQIKNAVLEVFSRFKADEPVTHRPAVLAARIILEDATDNKVDSIGFGFAAKDRLHVLRILKTVLTAPIVDQSNSIYWAQVDANREAVSLVYARNEQIRRLMEDSINVISDSPRVTSKSYPIDGETLDIPFEQGMSEEIFEQWWETNKDKLGNLELLQGVDSSKILGDLSDEEFIKKMSATSLENIWSLALGRHGGTEPFQKFIGVLTEAASGSDMVLKTRLGLLLQVLRDRGKEPAALRGLFDYFIGIYQGERQLLGYFPMYFSLGEIHPDALSQYLADKLPADDKELWTFIEPMLRVENPGVDDVLVTLLAAGRYLDRIDMAFHGGPLTSQQEKNIKPIADFVNRVLDDARFKENLGVYMLAIGLVFKPILNDHAQQVQRWRDALGTGLEEPDKPLGILQRVLYLKFQPIDEEIPMKDLTLDEMSGDKRPIARVINQKKRFEIALINGLDQDNSRVRLLSAWGLYYDRSIVQQSELFLKLRKVVTAAQSSTDAWERSLALAIASEHFEGQEQVAARGEINTLITGNGSDLFLDDLDIGAGDPDDSTPMIGGQSYNLLEVEQEGSRSPTISQLLKPFNGLPSDVQAFFVGTKLETADQIWDSLVPLLTETGITSAETINVLAGIKVYLSKEKKGNDRRLNTIYSFLNESYQRFYLDADFLMAYYRIAFHPMFNRYGLNRLRKTLTSSEVTANTQLGVVNAALYWLFIESQMIEGDIKIGQNLVRRGLDERLSQGANTRRIAALAILETIINDMWASDDIRSAYAVVDILLKSNDVIEKATGLFMQKEFDRNSEAKAKAEAELIALLNQISLKNADSAMIAKVAPRAEKNLVQGGIDFYQTGDALQIKRDGNGVALPVQLQDIDNININGLVPNIIEVQPLSTPYLRQLLSLDEQDSETRLSAVSG